jgi:hypothetical protein
VKKAQWRDPIVEEIHRFREAYAKKLGYDSEKIFQDLRRRQEESGTPVISLSPRPAARPSKPRGGRVPLSR